MSSELRSVVFWEGVKIRRSLLECLQNSGRSCVTSTGGSGHVFAHHARLMESRGIAWEGWGAHKGGEKRSLMCTGCRGTLTWFSLFFGPCAQGFWPG